MGSGSGMSSATLGRIRFTASPTSRQVVISQSGDEGPCSACETRSTATVMASALRSAMIADSVGPASTSMPTRPNSSRFASATYALPGPTMMSARGAPNRPKTIVATACTPPISRTMSAPARSRAKATAGSIDSPRGGVQATTKDTPATLAVVTLMMADATWA